MYANVHEFEKNTIAFTSGFSGQDFEVRININCFTVVELNNQYAGGITLSALKLPIENSLLPLAACFHTN